MRGKLRFLEKKPGTTAPAKCDDAVAAGEGYEKGATLGEDKLRGELYNLIYLNVNMKYTLFIPIFMIASSCLHVKTKVESDKPTAIHKDTMSIIEKNLFMSCPISKGPIQVISYLEGVPSFIRNKEYDNGNGSVRFNAKNATFFDTELIDSKSLFLLNYNTTNGDYKFSLFQAIYFFKSKNDMKYHLEKILDLLKNGLKLKSKTMYDALKNPYFRFYLPDGSGFNLKHSPEESDKHVIDILWVPDAN